MHRARLSLPVLLAAVVLLAPILASCGGGQGIAPRMDDAALTARVKTVLLNDPQLDATHIDVSTSAAVVTLNGTVKSASDQQRAVQLARQVEGVKDVRSNLQLAR